MKKAIALLLAAMMILSLAACGGENLEWADTALAQYFRSRNRLKEKYTLTLPQNYGSIFLKFPKNNTKTI